MDMSKRALFGSAAAALVAIAIFTLSPPPERSEPIGSVEPVRLTVATTEPTQAPTPEPTPEPTQAPEPAEVAAPEPVEPVSVPAGGIPAAVAAAWPGNDAEALAVARCESISFTPSVVYGPRTGAAGERGVMQIHPTHRDGMVAQLGYTWDQMFQIGPNVAVAWGLYQEAGGWGPWTCRP